MLETRTGIRPDAPNALNKYFGFVHQIEKEVGCQRKLPFADSGSPDKMRAALTDLYKVEEGTLPREVLSAAWGDELYRYEELYKRLREKTGESQTTQATKKLILSRLGYTDSQIQRVEITANDDYFFYYNLQRNIKKTLDKYPDLTENSEYGRLVVTDLFFAEKDSAYKDTIRKDLGGDLEKYLAIYNRVQENMSQDSVYSAWMLTRLGHSLVSLPEIQQLAVFELAGYSREEARDKFKNVALSVVLSAGATAVAYPLVGSATFVGATSQIRFDNESLSRLAVIGSYFLHYGSLYLKAVQNYRLLSDPAIQTCPDPISTAAHQLLEDSVSLDELQQKKLLKNSALVASLSEVVWQEPWFIAGMLSSPSGDAAVIARNLAGFAFNAGLIAADELWLRYVNARQRRLEKATSTD